MDNAAFVALNRFGFGWRPGLELPERPRAWLRAQLNGTDTFDSSGLPDTAAALQVVADQFAMRALRDKQESAGATEADKAATHPVGELVKREANALMGQALMTEAPFRERLVWFWANHFTVSAKSLVSAGCAGAFWREAIRPHVTGRFADMLQAVMHHPAMLDYLNQQQSAGPNSKVGLRRNGGLNENLARECLELHTVTPASGYTQADVTNFAKLLTGLSIEGKNPPLGFRYRPNLHEPGPIEVMGQVWPDGEQGATAMLDWLGTHPATYQHLAEKLVRHFVADEPPRADVRRIAAVLHDTNGDLGAASAAVIELPGAWEPSRKLRAPQEYVIACLRAVGSTPAQVPNIGSMPAGLGQAFFQAPFPIGWPDRAADWAGAEAMLQRVDFVYGLSMRWQTIDPEQLAHASLGPVLSATTLEQVRMAGSRRDGLTLLLSSPEFQRR
jgi:uncharacterized protein (DUF1800 family)